MLQELYIINDPLTYNPFHYKHFDAAFMKFTKTIALLSLSGFILFFIIVVTLHFLRTDKNILTSFVSEYAVGNYSWLMTIAFYCIITGATLLLIGLSINTRATKKSIITLGIFCIGFLLVSIFPTDVPVNPPSPHGLIHALAAVIALTCLGISMITWSYVFKTEEQWKSLAGPSLFYGVCSLILFFVHFASPTAWKGITQRFLILWDISWLIVLSCRLYYNKVLENKAYKYL